MTDSDSEPELQLTEDPCEFLADMIVALQMCDYSAVQTHISTIGSIAKMMPDKPYIHEIFGQLVTESLTEECPKTIQEHLVSLFDIFVMQGDPQPDTLRLFLGASASFIQTCGKRDIVLRILDALTNHVQRYPESRSLIHETFNSDVILFMANVSDLGESDCAIFAQFLRGIVEPDDVQLMLSRGELTRVKLWTIALVIVDHTEVLDVVNVEEIAEMLLTDETITPSVRLSALSKIFSQKVVLGAPIQAIFGLLSSDDIYVAASAFLTVACFADSPETAMQCVQCGILECIETPESFIVKREWARCVSSLLLNVPVETGMEIISQDMTESLLEVVSGVDGGLGSQILDSLRFLKESEERRGFVVSLFPIPAAEEMETYIEDFQQYFADV